MKKISEFFISTLIFVFIFASYVKANKNDGISIYYFERDTFLDFINLPNNESLNSKYKDLKIFEFGEFENTKMNVRVSSKLKNNQEVFLGFDDSNSNLADFYFTQENINIFNNKEEISEQFLNGEEVKEFAVIDSIKEFYDTYPFKKAFPTTVWAKTNGNDYFIVQKSKRLKFSKDNWIVYTKKSYLDRYGKRLYTLSINQKKIADVEFIGDRGIYPLKDITDVFGANMFYDHNSNSLNYKYRDVLYAIKENEGKSFIESVKSGEIKSVVGTCINPKYFIVNGNVFSYENLLDGFLGLYGAKREVNHSEKSVDISQNFDIKKSEFSKYFDSNVLYEKNKKYIAESNK